MVISEIIFRVSNYETFREKIAAIQNMGNLTEQNGAATDLYYDLNGFEIINDNEGVDLSYALGQSTRLREYQLLKFVYQIPKLLSAVLSWRRFVPF